MSLQWRCRQHLSLGIWAKAGGVPAASCLPMKTTIPPVHHHSSTECVKHSCCVPGETVFTWIKTVRKVSSQILSFRRPCTEADGKFHDGASQDKLRREPWISGLRTGVLWSACCFLEDIITSSVMGKTVCA